jgi:diguanylate cyclase (GGDEF)-like protein
MSGENILIVEDDAVIAVFLKNLLSRKGYSVTSMLARGEDVVQTAQQQPTDLVLMDMILAGEMNGLQAAAQLHQAVNIPVIFMTAFSEDNLFQQAKLAGSYGYLNKPIRERDLFFHIEIALHRHQLDQKMRRSEARYRALFEDAPVAIMEVDFSRLPGFLLSFPNQDMATALSNFNSHPEEVSSLLHQMEFIDANRQMLEMLHLGTIAEVQNMDPAQNVEMAHLLIQGISSFMDDEKPTEFSWETPLTLLDGTHIHVSGRAVFANDPEQSRDHILVYLQDISHRNKIEKELKEANQQLSMLVESLRQREQETSLLGQMGDFLQSSQKVEEVYQVVGNFATRLFKGMNGALYIFPPSHTRLDRVECWGEHPPERTSFNPEDCWAIRRGRTHLVETRRSRLVCRHSDFKMGEEDFQPFVCIPVQAQGEVQGSLVLSHIPAERVQDVLSLAGIFCERTAIAISNLRLRERLMTQSIQDSLTGLYNRLHMENSLERELTRAIRHARNLCVVMLDIDYFKPLNDELGHDAGDMVLQDLGKFLQTHIRTGDVACRYGGDEFTLILPESTLEDACKRVEGLRQGIKKLHFEYRGIRLPAITLSFGVAAYPQNGAFSRDLLLAADTALYRAKQEGRDRISTP